MFERAYILLYVAEKALLFPGLRPLHDAALKELQAIMLGAPRAIPSTPEPDAVDPSINVKRDVFDGVPGPAEKADDHE